VPPTHPWPEIHCVPHVWQLALSVKRSAQVPAQFTVPAGQVHIASSQMRLPPQVSEQRPQWSLFDARSTHDAPHWVNPDAAQRTAHVPSLQIGASAVHPLPHAPQFALLEARFSQSPAPERPPAHWTYPGEH
jgi:hypothetical protein